MYQLHCSTNLYGFRILRQVRFVQSQVPGFRQLIKLRGTHNGKKRTKLTPGMMITMMLTKMRTLKCKSVRSFLFISECQQLKQLALILD